jgi:hypothetical protein
MCRQEAFVGLEQPQHFGESVPTPVDGWDRLKKVHFDRKKGQITSHRAVTYLSGLVIFGLSAIAQ